MREVEQKDYDGMILAIQKIAAEFRAMFDHIKSLPSYPIDFGWAVLYRSNETDKYELCPCDSIDGAKYKFCCLSRSKKFREANK